MKRALLLALLLTAACSHEAPPGQQPLLNFDAAAFKQQFNAAPGERLLLLLSPT